MRASGAWRTGWCSLSVLISAGNAALRYLFSYSSNGFIEVQWYLFGASVFLGASYTLKRNEHVRVDVVYSHLSPRGRLYVDVVRADRLPAAGNDIPRLAVVAGLRRIL